MCCDLFTQEFAAFQGGAVQLGVDRNTNFDNPLYAELAAQAVIDPPPYSPPYSPTVHDSFLPPYSFATEGYSEEKKKEVPSEDKVHVEGSYDQEKRPEFDFVEAMSPRINKSSTAGDYM